jgi:hypothetical protein
MSSTDEHKPAAKSGRRKKGETRRQKSDVVESPAPVHMQNPEPDQQPQPEPDRPQIPEEIRQADFSEPVEAVAAVPDAALDPAFAAAPSPVEPPPAEPPSSEPPSSEPVPVSLQTIANAYRDYTRKSFEAFGSFFEQLSGARSLDKAVEVQTEFVKRAYENSVAESQKIRDLHRKLARQTFEPFQDSAGKTQETREKP